MQQETDWNQIYEWDNKYYFHVKQTADEYRFIPVSHTEGNYVYLANGMKILDFCSQVIAANLGHKNPRVTLEIYSHWIPQADTVGSDLMDANRHPQNTLEGENGIIDNVLP